MIINTGGHANTKARNIKNGKRLVLEDTARQLSGNCGTYGKIMRKVRK